MNFDWLGTSNVYGTENNTGLLDWTIYNVDVDNFGTIVSATSDQDVIIGHFEDADKNAGFMVTNVTAPVDDLDAKVSITLADEYKGALIIHEGVETVVALTDGKLELEIESGSAKFVIPLKEKK